MDWHTTLKPLRAAVTSDPDTDSGQEGQADDLLLAEWAKGIEKQRRDLAVAMREARKPHTARLLEEPDFPELRAYLLGGKAPERELQLQDPRLLKALAVWLLHHPLDEPQAPQGPLEKRARPVLDLARALRRNEKADLARRLLQQRLWWGERFPLEMRPEIRHELALCISMSPDLAPGPRLDSALELLAASDYLPERAAQANIQLGPETGKKSERARYVAWVHRQRWESYRQRSDLEKARDHYERALEECLETDTTDLDTTDHCTMEQLRNAADAAHCCDLLGDSEKAAEIRLEAVGKATSEGKRTDAPEEIKRYELLHYRWLLNLAKLEIRLQKDRQAPPWVQRLDPVALLKEASNLRGELLPTWIQTRKGLEIARTKGVEDAHLQALLGRDAVQPSLSLAKVGLGLSGGGFRASLFHLGVLASLAERDLLKRVEVLSCVSGGSIVGAHFYLKLRHLLTDKLDAKIERGDYIELVRELIHEFLAGVQKNLRTRVVANPLANLRMLLTPYTRSARAGDLMDRHLFRRVRDDRADGDTYWRLCDLRVQPAQPADQPRGTGFHPGRDNWKRAHKVPILTLNAASLNTGHSWQFAATWMGESPSAIEPEVDSNDRLRRMKLQEEAPPRHGQTRLGQAVAASACVPGLFEPSTLHGLYPGRLVRLVDGGVFDNQGVAGLVEQGCRIFLVSDASGQMEAQDRPHGGLLGSLFRANTVLMDRVRQTQYQNLRARKRAQQLDELVYVHLKQDLDVRSIDWLGCDDPKGPKTGEEIPPYGIPKDTQALLAGIRTDLDSFCDAEAYALMYSGYQMMNLESEQMALEPTAADWPFLCVEPRLREKLEPGGLKSLLTVARKGAFKIWRLWFGRPVAKWAAGAVALLSLAWLSSFYISWLGGSWRAGDEAALTVSMTVLGLVPLVAVALFVAPPLRAVVGRSLNLLVFGVLGMVVAWAHLAVFDPLYLRRGREPGGFARRLLHEGKVERNEGKVKRARKIFERLVAKSSRDWLAQVGLARALIELKSHQKASEALVAARSELERQVEDMDEQCHQTPIYDRGPKLELVDPPRLVELKNRKKYVEALAVANYTRRIDLDQENAELLKSRGDLLLAVEKWDEALEDYDRAIALIKPQNLDEHACLLQGRGDALKGLGRFEEALEAYEAAIDLKREEVACFKGLGETLEKLDRNDEALEAYDRGLALDPENEGLKIARARVEPLDQDQENDLLFG